MGTPIGDLLVKKPFSLDQIANEIVAVDGNNTAYQFLASIRNYDGTPLSDSQGRVTSHLSGFFYRTLNWMEKGIKPVFVFDGPPHPLKEKTLQLRREIRTKAKEEHEAALEAGDMEAAKKFGSRALHLSSDMIDQSKTLLQALGVPVIQAPQDSEAQCAVMVARHEVFASVSQDYDSLLFGCPELIRNVATSGKRKIPGKNAYAEIKPEIISLEESLTVMKLSRQQLIWLGMLLGTDFNDKIPSIGPKTAMKLIQKATSFENIIKEAGKTIDFDPKNIEDIFWKPQATPPAPLKFESPNIEKVRSILCDQFEFSPERIDSTLNKIVEKENEKSKQKTMSSWFS